MIGYFDPLRNIRREGSPTREFQRALWTKLSTAYDREHGCERRTSPFLRFATVGLTAVVLVFGMGTGVYAYESPEVVEGHPLYLVKQGLEQMEEMTAFTPEARARFHTKMMGRRMNEASYALSRQDQAELLLSKAAEELGMSVEELKAGMKDPETRQAIVDELSQQNAGYTKLLQRVPFHGGRSTNGPSIKGEQGTMRQLSPELREQLIEIREDIWSSDLTDEEKRTLFREELQKLLEEEREEIINE